MASRTADTLRLQKALKFKGFDPGPLDGKPGKLTSAALMAWQESVKDDPQGIDVSRWQPEVDWRVVKEVGKESFAICKATQGLYVDKMFAKHWHGIKEAGLLRGAYVWLEPHLSLVAQADFAFKVIGELEEGDLNIWIDGERHNAGLDKILGTKDDIKINDHMVETFAGLLQERFKRKCCLYSYVYFLDDNDIEANNCDLAIADYRSGPATIPPGYPRELYHQFLGDKGTEPGVKGPCDQIRFNGSLEELRALAGY